MESIVEEAIRQSGGIGSLAKAFGISAQAVHKWRKGGVPADRVVKLSKVSGIALHRLRPDLYPFETGLPSLQTSRKRA